MSNMIIVGCSQFHEKIHGMFYHVAWLYLLAHSTCVSQVGTNIKESCFFKYWLITGAGIKVGDCLSILRLTSWLQQARSRWKVIENTSKFQGMLPVIQGTKIKARKIWAARRYGNFAPKCEVSIGYGIKSLQAYLQNGSKNFQKNLGVYIPWLELLTLETWSQTQ